ncbi:MAG: hypothetical protein WCH99_11745 [Verrucomicrobiota bacterium]
MLADVAIPIVFKQWPLMLGALVPVIIVEALLIRRWVQLSYRDAFIGMTKANLLSTLAGIPLAWLVMFVLFVIMVPVAIAQDKWHMDFSDSLVFQVVSFVIGMGFLLVPSFYVSVWLESRICRRAWPGIDPVIVRRGVFRANLASYIMVFILACGWAGIEFFIHRP